MIGGQLRPDRGDRLPRRQGYHPSPRAQERFRRGIGRTFQIAQAFHSMTRLRERPDGADQPSRRKPRGLAPARERHRELAMALLEQVGMAAAADRPCSELAYGDVKRVELAVALAGDPKLLLMDEPTAGMALRERAALMELTHGHRSDAPASACCSPSTTWMWCSATPPECSSCCVARSSRRAGPMKSARTPRCGGPISATRRRASRPGGAP